MTQGGHAPAITKSCTTPAIALSTTSAKAHSEVDWSVTGPPGMRYLVMVGVGGFTSTGDRLVATPDPGLSKDQIQPGSQRQEMDGDCLQSGRFGVLVPAGTYNVRVFRLEPSGSSAVSPVIVATKRLTVIK